MKRLLCVLLLLSIAAWGGSLAGKRAGSFTLPDSTGKFYDLLDYRGKPVLVDIMRTDCPHCLALSKTLERLKARYGDKIVILSIVNPPDSPQSVAQFIAKNKVSTPILFDCGQAAAALLRITPQNPTVNLPHMILIDAQGVVKDDWVYGESQNAIFDGDALFPIIDSMLKAGGK